MEINHLKNILFKLKKKLQKNSFKNTIKKFILMSDLMVETQQLTKQFKLLLAVDNVNLQIPKGTIFALLGPNGAGKTTTIRMLLGLLKPTFGSIKVNNIDVTLNPKAIRGKIGLLPQFSAAYYDLTPIQNIKFILELNNIAYEEVYPKLIKYFQTLEITQDLLNKPFSKLSGGEQRSISFIMAIITNKEFLILDEPTTGLDPIMADVINELILNMRERLNITSLAITHDMKSAYKIADRIAMLFEGQIIQIGTPEEIQQTENPIVYQFITGSAKGPITDGNH